MSWFERRQRPNGADAPGRRVFLRNAGTFFGVTTLASLTAACGFRPLNAPQGGGPLGQDAVTPSAQLAKIQIRPIEGRAGQVLHNLLRDRLNPSGQPRSPDYQLTVGIRQTTQEQNLEQDETATRVQVTLQASYNLTANAGGTVLHSGRARSINSYNILDLDVFYSVTVAEQDAVERSLREIADNIQLQLAVYFAEVADSGASG